MTLSRMRSKSSMSCRQLAENLDDQLRRLQETDALIQGALSRLQDSVMGLRVVPVELVFKRFPRMVRDLALAQGKQIRLELIGQEVKIDKAMVESLADPLLAHGAQQRRPWRGKTRRTPPSWQARRSGHPHSGRTARQPHHHPRDR
jgi:chemotaxis protein histidine kinase CheA